MRWQLYALAVLVIVAVVYFRAFMHL